MHHRAQLREEMLDEVYKATIEAGLAGSRRALLSGLGSYEPTLERHSSPAAQILSDLSKMNEETGPLIDGTQPLVRWLTNAVQLVGPRRESKVFQRALGELRGGGPQQTSRSTHFLDVLPFDLSHPGAQEIQTILATIYWNTERAVEILRRSGINLSSVNLNQSMKTGWGEILYTARAQDKLRALLQQALADVDAGAWHTRLRELMAAAPAVEPRVHVAWKGDEKSGARRDPALERQIEERPTLLSVAFLERGVYVAAAVARMRVTYRSGEAAVGTTFRIGEGLLLTNHHVLFDTTGAPAANVEIWFRFEVDLDGRSTAHRVYGGDPLSIVGERESDWAVIRPKDPLDAEYPILRLAPARPVRVNDRVYIIQHPRGGPKQISLHHNDVRYVDNSIVQYRTDTEGGSSGAPVFDERWEIVALHHGSTETVQENGQYWNQGIRIERVVQGLRAKNVMP